MAHLKVLMTANPQKVAQLLKNTLKELLLRGVCGSSRCGMSGEDMSGEAKTLGIAAAEAARVFHASTRRRISARILCRPSVSAVVTVMAGFCVPNCASICKFLGRKINVKDGGDILNGGLNYAGKAILCIA